MYHTNGLTGQKDEASRAQALLQCLFSSEARGRSKAMTEPVDTAERDGNGGATPSGRLRAFAGWVRHDFVWWLLIVPVLFSAAVYVVSERDILGWGDSSVFKDLMEIVHPGLVAGFLLVSWLRWRRTRDNAFAFLGILSMAVLARELIGQGSSIVLYLALIGLTVYATRHGEKVAALFPSKWAASFLVMCFVCYAASQLLDRGVIKRIGWLLLWDTSWKPPHSSNLEEALESLGGFFLFLTPFSVRPRGSREES